MMCAATIHMYNVPSHIAHPNRKHAQHGSSTNAPDCTAPYPLGLLPTDIGRRREQVAAKAKAGANTGGIQLPHYNCCCYCCYCYRTSHTLIHSHTHTHIRSSNIHHPPMSGRGCAFDFHHWVRSPAIRCGLQARQRVCTQTNNI